MIQARETRLLDTSTEALEMAIASLRDDGLVAFPTDTLYALGANPFSERAMKRLHRAKGRPTEKAIPLLIAEPSQIEDLARFVPEIAWELVREFMPGGLTIVLPKSPLVPSLVASGETVAMRIPDHPVALALLRGMGLPITGTSANLSGAASPITAQDVLSQMSGKIDLILDGGPCPLGRPSTLLDLSGARPRLLREGAVPREALGRWLGMTLLKGG